MTINRIPDDWFGVVCIKGNEKYAIIYKTATRNDALRQLGRWASDPGLSFGWTDAAKTAVKMELCEAGNEK